MRRVAATEHSATPWFAAWLPMRDHRSLEAWKEARAITAISIQFGRTHWKPLAAALLTQLQRATLSVQLNIAEGYALKTPRRFANHLTIAYGSAVEVVELFRIVAEEGIVPTQLAEEGIHKGSCCQAMLLGLIKRYRGA